MKEGAEERSEAGSAAAGRILVGIDDTEPGSPSMAALRWAIDEARGTGAGLCLLHAVIPPVTASAFGPSMPAPLDLIDSLAATLPDDVDAVTSVALGGAAGTLLDAAHDARLVVLGSRGRGGFTGLLLGSTGDQVAGRSRCPAIIVRQEPPADGTRVVLGVDGSPTGERAMQFAFEIASRRGWSVVAVHAWEVPSYDLVSIPGAPVPVALHELGDDEMRLSSQALAGARADFPDVEVAERVVRGAAAPAILEAAGEPGTALIVVGSAGHGQLAGVVLGSTSRAVLHRAQVPVAVVPREPR